MVLSKQEKAECVCIENLLDTNRSIEGFRHTGKE
jgi:dUTPase